MNDHFEEVVGDSIDEVDRTVDLEIQEYQKQIDTLEAKKREANQYFDQIDKKTAKRIVVYRRQIAQLESMMAQEERWSVEEKEHVGKNLLKRNAGSVLPSRPKS